MKKIITLTLVAILFSSTCYADLSTVYETIIYESANQSLAGQVAVAKVIRNRAEERHMSFEQVCLQPKQFSCWNTSKHRQYTSEELETAKEAWNQSATNNSIANMYCTVNCHPSWESKVQYIETIGDHKFFYERR